ncbi:MAG: 4a-hydroxytetrahydrobiopterin dehydratase [Verrucomicrobia bacterium]|nr:4a-hydroxytetrahydrobiopterin dehydratase [Verrucomicrobiota bacterium]
MSAALSTEQIQAALASLPGWQLEGAKLLKSYEFKDFKAALAFLNQVGALAEAQGHHPEIHNIWNQVSLRLCTHDAGDRITEKDLTLARALQSLSHP